MQAAEQHDERTRQRRATAALLKTYRRRIPNLTQYRLAQVTGIHHSHIARIELAERRPSPDVLDRLASALGLDESEHDTVRLAAGYPPNSEGGNPLLRQLLREPAVLALLHLMRDTSVPDAALDGVRQGVHAMVAAVRAMQPPVE